MASSEKPLDIQGEGAAPILVLGTTRDPATPLKWAEALAAQLDSGVLVKRDGDGHTAYNSDNACIDEIVEGSWFVVPGLPDDVIAGPRTDLWFTVLRRQSFPLAMMAYHPGDLSRN